MKLGSKLNHDFIIVILMLLVKRKINIYITLYNINIPKEEFLCFMTT